jgi:hypothetical protein
VWAILSANSVYGQAAAATANGPQLLVSDTQSVAPFNAQLQQLSDSVLTVTTGGSSREIALANLRSVQFEGAELAGAGPFVVAMRDGSNFSATSLISQGTVINVKLVGGSELAAPTKSISDIRLRELTDSQRTQWQAIRDSRLTADMLVLVRSEESLDKIEGIINRITPEAVEFEFSGQTIPAPLAKLAGMRFYSKTAGEAPAAKLAAVVRDTSGGSWNAAKLTVTPGSDSLELTLRDGLVFQLPLNQLRDIDFAVGSMKYVATLTPVARTASERFPLANAVAGSESLFGPRVATGQDSKAGPSLQFLGSGSVTYRIPAEFTRLVGSVELNPPGNKVTPCNVQVLIEKKVVWEQRLTSAKQPLQIDLPVTSDERVQFVVNADSNLPVGDVVLFRELRFLK